MKKVISTTNAPAAIGPYSQAIEVNGMVFASGQIPVNPATGEIPEGIEAQAEQVLNNVKNLDSKSYVNPVCYYYGTLLKDKNGDVVGINFEQNGLNLSKEQITTAIQNCKQKLEE